MLAPLHLGQEETEAKISYTPTVVSWDGQHYPGFRGQNLGKIISF